jgi:hypothetical protein
MVWIGSLNWAFLRKGEAPWKSDGTNSGGREKKQKPAELTLLF